ncbi:unnamed protein product [Blepharisma stoltei]|uniref:LITAF domain-containing protein n=1 Tax=Blepharisma stoltei TaxID=1481888 RepID=A0AAU9J4T0_9CILI|nr:unnamed protein product [Blepharisma stoltei]
MASLYTSPEKVFDPLSTPAPDTVQRTMSACIFTNSDRKAHHRSQNSERRYTQNAQNFDEILSESFLSASSQKEDVIEVKAGKLLDFKENAVQQPPQHHRQGSHQRKRSICIVEEIPADKLIQEIASQSRVNSYNNSTRNTSKVPSEDGWSNPGSRNQSPKYHTRHISDADSVIYMGFGDDLTNSRTFGNQIEIKKSNVIINEEITVVSKNIRELVQNDENAEENPVSLMKKSRQSYERNPLPVLGNTPSSVYCTFCKTYVHTKIDFLSGKVPGPLLRMVSSVFACCQIPSWLNTMRVHRCPNCTLVLAKSR